MSDELIRDLRYAVRTLRRQPGFVVAVVSTFALAIGTNAAMLGLVTRLMLAPPPGIRDAARIQRVEVVRTDPSGETYAMTTTSYPTFSVLEQQRGLSGVAAVRSDTM